MGLLGTVGVLLVASEAHAQCTKDTDCKGDRVCEGGACVAAPAAPQPAPAPGAVVPAPAAPAPEVAAAPAAPAPAPAATTLPAAPSPEEAPAPVQRRRHSTGMMAGGIVMVSFSPIALLVAAVANAEQTACELGSYRYNSTGDISTEGVGCDDYDATIYGGLISAAVLAGVGIPLIVIGGKKEPVNQIEARIAPWATPHAAGVGLRIDM